MARERRDDKSKLFLSTAITGISHCAFLFLLVGWRDLNSKPPPNAYDIPRERPCFFSSVTQLSIVIDPLWDVKPGFLEIGLGWVVFFLVVVDFPFFIATATLS